MYLLFKSQICWQSRTSSRSRTIFKIWRRQSAGAVAVSAALEMQAGLETAETRITMILRPKMKSGFLSLSMAALIGCLFIPMILSAEDPSPAPTPSLEERVSDLEQRIQSIEHIPVVAFALKLRGPTEQNAAATPATTPQSDSPLQLVGWEYRFKEGQQSYENRHVFTYILKNVSQKPIKLIHGTLLFTDLLGEKIVAIKLNPDVEYPSGQTASTSGEWDVSPLNPGEKRMATMNHNDIKATLLIQGVAFDDNSTWTAGKQQ
jgi:hypothetical protein